VFCYVELVYFRCGRLSWCRTARYLMLWRCLLQRVPHHVRCFSVFHAWSRWDGLAALDSYGYGVGSKPSCILGTR
jgi:hypothetical protein